MSNDIFFISDPHFDHDVIRVFCERPYASVEEMNECMLDNWNGIVGKKDRVIIGGDFAWKNHNKWINALNGKKTLVTGNHDRMGADVLSNFTRVIGTAKMPGIMQGPIRGQYCVICHFPMWSWNASAHGSWHFHGHTHGRKVEVPDVLSCGIDADTWDLTPVPWEVLEAKMQSKIPAWEARRAEMNAVDIAGRDKNANVKLLSAENRNWRMKGFCNG